MQSSEYVVHLDVMQQARAREAIEAPIDRSVSLHTAGALPRWLGAISQPCLYPAGDPCAAHPVLPTSRFCNRKPVADAVSVAASRRFSAVCAAKFCVAWTRSFWLNAGVDGVQRMSRVAGSSEYIDAGYRFTRHWFSSLYASSLTNSGAHRNRRREGAKKASTNDVTRRSLAGVARIKQARLQLCLDCPLLPQKRCKGNTPHLLRNSLSSPVPHQQSYVGIE